MIMKKIFITITAVLALMSSLVMAKTEGNSVGINVLSSSADIQGFDSDNEFGVGVSSKHAINFGNNIFVAPGVFYHQEGAEATITAASTVAEVDNVAGVAIDLGYDFNDQISAFVSIGLSQFRTETSQLGVTTSIDNDEANIIFGILFNKHQSIILIVP